MQNLLWGRYSAGVVANALLVNTPQLIATFIYLFCNDMLTRMLMSREWAQFASTRRTLRVSKPQGQQRSTYWLQLPYRYSVPLMGAMVLLHWLMSRGLFLASIREQWEPCSDPGHRRLRLLTPGNPARFLPDHGHDRGTNLAGALQVHQCGHPCRELLLCGHQCGGPPAGLRSRQRGRPSAIAIRCCPRDCSRDAEAEVHWHGQNALC